MTTVCRPVAVALLMLAWQVAAQPMTVFWEEVPDERAACYANTAGLAVAFIRPRYRFTLGSGDAASTTILLAGTDTFYQTPFKDQLPNSSHLLPAVLRSKDGGASWRCAPSVSAASRHAAVPVSFTSSPPTCAIACIAGGSDVVNGSLKMPSVGALCSRDRGATWASDAWFPRIHAATAAQAGDYLYYFGGLVQDVANLGQFLPSGLLRQAVNVGSCTTGVAMQLLSDSDFLAGLRGRVWVGLQWLPQAGLWMIQGGCKGNTMPGYGTPPLECVEDVWFARDLADPSSYYREISDLFLLTGIDDWQPSLLAELRPVTDLMLPYTAEYVSNTSTGSPGVVVQKTASYQLSADRNFYRSMTAYVHGESTLVRVTMSLSGPVYENYAPYLNALWDGKMIRGVIGQCSGTCGPNQWSLGCRAVPYVPGCMPCFTCDYGTYMQEACTAASNTVCSPCSACTGGLVPVGGCDGVVDTICGTASSSPTPSTQPSPTTTASRGADATTAPVPTFIDGGATASASASANALTDATLRPAQPTDAWVPPPAQQLVQVAAMTILAGYASITVALGSVRFCAPVEAAAGVGAGAGAGGHRFRHSFVGSILRAGAQLFPIAASLFSWWMHLALALVAGARIDSALCIGLGGMLMFVQVLRAVHVLLATYSLSLSSARVRSLHIATQASIVAAVFAAVAFWHQPAARKVLSATSPVRVQASRGLRSAVSAHMLLLLVPTATLDILLMVFLASVASGAWVLLLVVCALTVLHELVAAAACLLQLRRLKDREAEAGAGTDGEDEDEDDGLGKHHGVLDFSDGHRSAGTKLSRARSEPRAASPATANGSGSGSGSDSNDGGSGSGSGSGSGGGVLVAVNPSHRAAVLRNMRGAALPTPTALSSTRHDAQLQPVIDYSAPTSTSASASVSSSGAGRQAYSLQHATHSLPPNSAPLVDWQQVQVQMQVQAQMQPSSAAAAAATAASAAANAAALARGSNLAALLSVSATGTASSSTAATTASAATPAAATVTAATSSSASTSTSGGGGSGGPGAGAGTGAGVVVGGAGAGAGGRVYGGRNIVEVARAAAVAAGALSPAHSDSAISSSGNGSAFSYDGDSYGDDDAMSRGSGGSSGSVASGTSAPINPSASGTSAAAAAAPHGLPRRSPPPAPAPSTSNNNSSSRGSSSAAAASAPLNAASSAGGAGLQWSTLRHAPSTATLSSTSSSSSASSSSLSSSAALSAADDVGAHRHGSDPEPNVAP